MTLTNIDSLLSLMRNRRTIRKFKADPIPEGYVEKILEAARWAPSGANSQPWEFVVVRDTKTKDEIADLFVESVKLSRKVDTRFPFSDKYIESIKPRISGAPVLIAVCGDKRLKDAYPKTTDREHILSVSIGAAIEHIHLAATALGLASSWGTVSIFAEERLKELLGVPDELSIYEVIQIGYPAEQPTRSRRSLDSIIHYERFNRSKLRSDREIKELITKRTAPDIYAHLAPKT